MADIATLGGATRGVQHQWILRLLAYTDILTCFDNDQAGKQGAARLAALSRQVKVLPLPTGNDLTEFWQLGGDLRVWFSFHLARLGIAPWPGTRHPAVAPVVTADPASVIPRVLKVEMAVIEIGDLPEYLKREGLSRINDNWPIGANMPVVTVVG